MRGAGPRGADAQRPQALIPSSRGVGGIFTKSIAGSKKSGLQGLAAGAVVPSQTKTVTVHADEGRLRRLLDSAGALD